MKILVVGGGSGGHITPAVAVVREILELKPRTNIEFWTDRKYYKNVVKITTEIGVKWGAADEGNAKKVHYIRVRKLLAGKYHRYAGWKASDYFKYWDVTLKDLVWGNIKGFCGFVGGVVQSFVRLVRKKTRPEVIFLKGGFVGLPVGMVARVLGIPYVVHESDAVPGLANRLLMKHAATVALGVQAAESFSSPTLAQPVVTGARRSPRSRCREGLRGKDSTVWTGTPVAPEYKPVSASRQKSLKKAYGFDPEQPLLVVTGGSQGAANINAAMREILPELLEFTSVGLVVGREHYEEMVDLKKKYEEWDKAKLKSNFRMWEFCTTMDELMGAADVVVSRAGATTIAELAALKKAVILVPYERLPGSHQVKNADKLAAAGAASVIYDARMSNQPGVLHDEVRRLMRSPRVRADLADKLHEQARPDAAQRLAEILLDVAAGK